MSNELMHYRTKGSKNGERNYQNEDGTWTDLGLERRRAEYASSTGRKIAKGINTAAGASVAVGEVGFGVRAAVKNKGGFERLSQPGKDGKASAGEKISRSTSDTIEQTKRINSVIDDKDKRPYLNDLSNEQLSKMIKRLELERNYSNLSKESMGKGKDWLDETLAIAGGIAGIIGSAASVAAAIWFIKNGGK